MVNKQEFYQKQLQYASHNLSVILDKIVFLNLENKDTKHLEASRQYWQSRVNHLSDKAGY
jgi:hypothetical protein